MKHSLILYSTVDGHTQKIAEFIAQHIKNNYHKRVTVLPLAEFIQLQQKGNLPNTPLSSQLDNSWGINNPLMATSNDLQTYDEIVIGASIRYGKHRQYVTQFVNQNKQVLADKNTAFFSVNLVARKAEKSTATTSPYVIKFLQLTNWQPTAVDVFAGKLDYSKYGFFDTIMIKFIMKVTKGPTHSDKPIEFTDWQRVTDFADKVGRW